MTVQDVMNLIEAKDRTPETDKETEVSCGYTCDLLSWVMAHGAAGMAWVTVQTHSRRNRDGSAFRRKSEGRGNHCAGKPADSLRNLCETGS